MNNLAFVPIGIAFFGFAITLIFASSRLQKTLSIATTVSYLGFAIWSLTWGVGSLPLSLQLGGWQSPFGITLQYDYLSALLVTVTAVIYLAVILYLEKSSNVEGSPLVLPLIHGLICGITGAFTTGDLFNLYVWFEVILLSSFVLLTLEKNKVRLAGAFKYVILNIISSFIFLFAAGLIYNSTHTLNFSQLSVNLAQLNSDSPHYVTTLSALLFVAFAIKSSLFPFFFWLPASYHNISPTLSALFAGLLTKVGLYGIIKINFLVFPQNDYLINVMLILSCISILVGVGGAIIQSNIRRILSFHIISQVGYIALASIFIVAGGEGIDTIGLAVTLFYMLHHILVKANLFMVSGLIVSLTGSENLTKIRGLLTTHPLLALLFAVPALSLAGIPPFSGFWAKLGLFQATLSAEYFGAAVVMIVGSFFTVFSMAKIWLGAFWGDSIARQDFSGLLSPLPVAACGMLSLATIAIGVNPDLLSSHIALASQYLAEVGG